MRARDAIESIRPLADQMSDVGGPATAGKLRSVPSSSGRGDFDDDAARSVVCISAHDQQGSAADTAATTRGNCIPLLFRWDAF